MHEFLFMLCARYWDNNRITVAKRFEMKNRMVIPFIQTKRLECVPWVFFLFKCDSLGGDQKF